MKFIARKLMSETVIDCDSIELILDDGQKIELCYNKSENIISLYAGRQLIVYPWSANAVKLEDRQ